MGVKKWLGGEGDKIKFLDLEFEKRQVVGLGKGRERQDAP